MVGLRPPPSLSWPLGTPLARNALRTAVQQACSDLRPCCPESKAHRLNLLRGPSAPCLAPCPAHPCPLGVGQGLFVPGSLLDTSSKRVCQGHALRPLPVGSLLTCLLPPGRSPYSITALSTTQEQSNAEAGQGVRRSNPSETTCGEAEGPQHPALREKAGPQLREKTLFPEPGRRSEHRWPWSSHAWHPARNPLQGGQNRPLRKLQRA